MGRGDHGKARKSQLLYGPRPSSNRPPRQPLSPHPRTPAQDRRLLMRVGFLIDKAPASDPDSFRQQNGGRLHLNYDGAGTTILELKLDNEQKLARIIDDETDPLRVSFEKLAQLGADDMIVEALFEGPWSSPDDSDGFLLTNALDSLAADADWRIGDPVFGTQRPASDVFKDLFSETDYAIDPPPQSLAELLTTREGRHLLNSIASESHNSIYLGLSIRDLLAAS